MTHDVNMSNTNLNMILQPFLDKLAVLTDTVQGLQAQVASMQLGTRTPMENELENDPELHTESSTKSEKWLNPPIYKDTWKDLRPFVSKLWSKLWQNHDQYPTNEEKVN